MTATALHTFTHHRTPARPHKQGDGGHCVVCKCVTPSQSDLSRARDIKWNKEYIIGFTEATPRPPPRPSAERTNTRYSANKQQ